jgi:hypothetical protein
VATVIVSDETIKNLIEAHASMAAWYYQMSSALQDAGATAEAPTEEQRKAFVAQFAQHFPELSGVAEQVTSPRPYIPPPAIPAPATVMENEGVTVPEPPKDHIAAPEYVASEEPPPPAPAPAATAASDVSPASPGEPPKGEGEPEDGPPKSTSTSGAPPPPPPMVDPSKVKYEE